MPQAVGNQPPLQGLRGERTKPSAFGYSFPIRRFDPDPFSGGHPQGNPADARGQGQRLVVVAMPDMNSGSGPDATLFQKLQQAAIPFIDAANLKTLPRLSLRQQQKAATATTGGTLHFGQVAVRTRDSTPEFGQQPGLEIRRD